MSSLLVDPGWIAANLDDPGVRVVEVDVSPALYDEGHIPGSVLWDAYRDLRHPDYTPISVKEFDEVLSRSGITPDTTVVLYGYAPYLGYWLLDGHGHRSIRVMDVPREAWVASGQEWSADGSDPGDGRYVRRREKTWKAELVAGREEVEDAIGRRDTVFLDVRSPEEFSGERFWPSGATEDVGRSGHVPGAVHVPVDLVREQRGRDGDTERLRAAYLEAGVEPGSRVITYCTIGNRASEVAFALKNQLDYPDVAIYYGSCAEWGHQPDTRVES